MPAKKKKSQNFLIGAALYTLLFAGGAESIGGHDSDNRCGGMERWEQKVLADPAALQINETPVETTIEDLTQIDTKKPDTRYKEDRPRMGIEMQVYKIKHCFITKILKEDDNDLHLVIEDGNKNTMIAEMPDPKCEDAKNSPWVQFYEEALATMLTYKNNFRHYMFTVTGVLFVDKSHGQTGKAPNNVEIHPILELKKEKKINPILQ